MKKACREREAELDETFHDQTDLTDTSLILGSLISYEILFNVKMI